jgi:hypothetical protein
VPSSFRTHLPVYPGTAFPSGWRRLWVYIRSPSSGKTRLLGLRSNYKVLGKDTDWSCVSRMSNPVVGGGGSMFDWQLPFQPELGTFPKRQVGGTAWEEPGLHIRGSAPPPLHCIQDPRLVAETLLQLPRCGEEKQRKSKNPILLTPILHPPSMAMHLL